MRQGGQLDIDGVAGANLAVFQDDRHHPGLANQVALFVAAEHGGGQSGLVVVQLRAGIAQAGQLDQGAFPQAQAGAGGQAEQVDATGGDVLAHGPRADGEAAGA